MLSFHAPRSPRALAAALAASLAILGLLLMASARAQSSAGQPILAYPGGETARVAGQPPATLAGAARDPAELAARWRVVDTPAALPGEGGRWVALDGQLAQDGVQPAAGVSMSETVLLSPEAIADGGIAASFYDGLGGTVGLVARHGAAGFYRLRLHTDPTFDGEALVLEKVVGGVAAPLLTQAGEPLYRRHSWHTLSLHVDGSHITATLDGQVIAAVHDAAPLPAGSAGLYARALGGLRFAQVALDGGE